ncbi:MAG: DUF3857 domain-containing protein [Candidatus Aminicenantes bacterium]|nr:DUF3857 domain-containing protein [Candidatus Aminicenantes bacterium]
MKKVSLILMLAFLIITPIQGQDDLSALVAGAGEAADFAGSNQLLVFDRTYVNVMDSGLSHVDKEVLYKVLTINGGKELKSLVFTFDPQTAYVEVKGAKVIKKDGRISDIPLSKVIEYPAPARAIYWGGREILLPVGRLEPGDGLWVKTYRKGFIYALLYQEEDDRYIPPMKGHFYDIIPFYSTVPIKTKTYEVSIPAGKRFQYEFYNGDAHHYAHVEGDRTVYYWEKKDIRPIKREPGITDFSDFLPKLLVSTSPDWKAKSLWFHKVNEDYGSFEYDDEIKQKTQEIIRDAADDWEKISRLTHWVAEEIRYSGISMGEGEGFTLHKGTMTFKDRCGVCKDKAGMLVTMLRAAGFESYPAMTMAGSRIDRIPADQFNHSVTLVKLNGKYHLLDPTWVPGVRELWSSAEQQQEYLMGVPEGADLLSTPLSPPEKHYLKYKIASRLSAQGHLQANIEIEAEGQSDNNLRRGFQRNLKESWPLRFQAEFSKIHPEANISDLVFHDPYDLSKPMKITFSLEIAHYFPPGVGETFFTPLSSRLPYANVPVFSGLEPFSGDRAYPFNMRCSQMVEVTETLQLPGGFKLIDPGPLNKIDGSGASFTGDIRQKGNAILITKTITLKKRVCQPEDWKSIRDSVLEFKKPGGDILVIVPAR